MRVRVLQCGGDLQDESGNTDGGLHGDGRIQLPGSGQRELRGGPALSDPSHHAGFQERSAKGF